MKRMENIRYLVTVAFIVIALISGCDYLGLTEIPPEELPHIPEECSEESSRLDNALFGAYTTAEVSQMQIRQFEDRLAECLKEEGFSRSEVKGMLKRQVKAMQDEVENAPPSSKGLYPF